MKKAYVFPGQGSQFIGMGLSLYENHKEIKDLFDEANEILGFSLTEIMFRGTEDDLKKTKVTQPAVFIHSVAVSKVLGKNFQPDMVAGHSLGEFSALVASRVLSFEDGLKLVSTRALAMQKACEQEPSTMAAIIGLDDEKVIEICDSIKDEVVVVANFNCPGQLVISGSKSGITKASENLKKIGAKRILPLKVGGAFHSPLMESAREELASSIEMTKFSTPCCPVYQNVVAKGIDNPIEIKNNLIKQLTSPVRWTESIKQMLQDGATHFIECGPGSVLQGLIKKITSGVFLEGYQ